MATKPILKNLSDNVKDVAAPTSAPRITDATKADASEEAKRLRRFMVKMNTSPNVLKRIREDIMLIVDAGIKRKPIHEYDPTEIGQSEAAADYLDGYILYSDGTGWVVYDLEEGRFKADYGEAVLNAVLKRLAKERWDLRKVIERGSTEATEALIFARSAAGKRCVANVAEFLKHDPTVFCLATDFDNDPYMLNCQGTTIDLRTGETIPSMPEHKHTRSTCCVPATDGKEPKRWSAFIKEITLGRLDLEAFLMRLCGYALTADTSAQWYFNFYGMGGNGKGVFLHVLQTIMGDYSIALPRKAVVLEGYETEGRFDVADLPGARLAIVDDVPAGRLAEGTIKMLTGGDKMRAEQKYKASYEFKPIAKLVLSSNKELALTDTGNSMRRRIRLIPFDFDARGKADPNLERKLLSEAPQILALFVKEAACYLSEMGHNGFPACPLIDNTSKAYVDDQDIVQQFLDSATECGDGVRSGELYSAYKAWCEASGYRVKSAKWLGGELKKKGVENRHTMKGNGYKGISLIVSE
jgi:putative DNA primase/helicase